MIMEMMQPRSLERQIMALSLSRHMVLVHCMVCVSYGGQLSLIEFKTTHKKVMVFSSPEERQLFSTPSLVHFTLVVFS